MNEQLAQRAYDIWKSRGVTYSSAVDAAFMEINPDADPDIAAGLFGVPLEYVPQRHREEADTPPLPEPLRAPLTPPTAQMDRSADPVL